MELSITIFLVAITVLVSMAAFQDHSIFEKLLFSPYAVQHRNQLYRMFSHGFIHADANEVHARPGVDLPYASITLQQKIPLLDT